MRIPMLKRMGFIPVVLALAFGVTGVPGTAMAGDCSPTGTNGILGGLGGAVVGGLLGHQVGKGNGKTAATVAGAVGGGFAGHAIGERSGQGDYGWQVVVQLQDGQYATVTQRNPPQVQVGDYVMIRGDQVYRY